MSNTIWKFALKIAGQQRLQLPAESVILNLQTQGNIPHLWAKVDPEAPLVYRRIFMCGTGHEVPETAGAFIGSFTQYSENFVFHVFDSAA